MAINEIRQQTRKSAAERVARPWQQRADLVKKRVVSTTLESGAKATPLASIAIASSSNVVDRQLRPA